MIYDALLVDTRQPMDPSADDGFEVSYVSGDGTKHRVPLAQAWAAPLEQGMPVRRFTSRKGQRHLSGGVAAGCAAGSSRSGGSPPRTAARSCPTTPCTRSTPNCPPAVAASAAAALLPHRKDAFRQELRAAAWQRVPSTCVVCERDNAVPPPVQERMSARAGTVSHIDSSHSPFLSRPAEVTAIIKETLAAVIAEAG